MKQIENILLIDDSKPTNFFNQRIIGKSDCIQKVLVAENGKEALDILESGIVPDVIFLDLNMPVMNGWEFLDVLAHAGNKFTNTVIILMIGAALGPEDKKKTDGYEMIKGFSEKILTKEKVEHIVRDFFPEVYQQCQKTNEISLG